MDIHISGFGQPHKQIVHTNVRSKEVLFAPVVVGLIGAILFGLSVYLLSISLDLKRSGITTYGTVLSVEQKQSKNSNRENEKHYYSNISFQSSNGQNYVINKSGKYTVGSSVELIYLPLEPQKARLNNNMELWIGPGIFSAFGLLLLALSGFLLYQTIKRRREIEWLLTHGKMIEATVIGVNEYETKTRRKSNRSSRQYHYRRSYSVVCQAILPDGNKMNFTSEKLKIHPGETHGQSITVFVDPQDYSKYYVNLD